MTAQWDNGNEININGQKVVVTVSGSQAYVATDQQVTEAAHYNAVYPDSIVHSIDGDLVTINLPKSYSYRTTGNTVYDGQQKIHMPMAARATRKADGSGDLNFKHLTGALLVHLTNNINGSGNFAGSDFYLERICVKCNHIISGERQFDLSLGPEEALKETDSHLGNGDTVIVMHFADQGREYAMEYGHDVEVLIPVPPVGRDNQFTIHVHGHQKSGSSFKEYTFSQRQGINEADNQNQLDRNKIAYVPVIITDSHVPTAATELTIRKDSVFFSSVAGFELIQKAVNAKATLSGKEMSGKTAEKLTYVLTDNINFEGEMLKHATMKDFAGTFDGRGYTLKNFIIKDSSLSSGSHHHIGLFYNLADGATIKNLNIEDMEKYSTGGMTNITKAYNIYVGAIAGQIPSGHAVTIENCHVKNVFTDASKINFRSQSTSQFNFYFGGLVGYTYTSSTKPVSITGCTFEGNSKFTLNLNSSSSSYKAIPGTFGGIVGYINGTPAADTYTISGSTVKDGSITASTTSTIGTVKYGYYYGNASSASSTYHNSCTNSNFKFTFSGTDNPDGTPSH